MLAAAEKKVDHELVCAFNRAKSGAIHLIIFTGKQLEIVRDSQQIISEAT